MRSPELNSKLDALTEKIYNGKVSKTRAGIILGEIKLNAKRPQCPRHKVEMVFGTEVSKWVCTEDGCKITAVKNDEPEPRKNPSPKKLKYSYSTMEGVYYAHYGDEVIPLNRSSVHFMPYTPYETVRNENGEEYIGEIVIRVTAKEYKVH